MTKQQCCVHSSVHIELCFSLCTNTGIVVERKNGRQRRYTGPNHKLGHQKQYSPHRKWPHRGHNRGEVYQRDYKGEMV